MESPFTGLELSKELEGKRPVAVMLDGSVKALPQAGIQDAGVVFVSNIEEKYIRYMAIFLDKAPSKVGPIRSARPYFIDWAVAYESFLAHCAGCPETIDRLSKERLIIDLDFAYLFNNKGKRVPLRPMEFFWLSDEKTPPHNVYMDIKRFRGTINLETIKTIKPGINFTKDKDVTDFSAYESFFHKNQKLISQDKAVFVEITRGKNNRISYSFLPSNNKYERFIYRPKNCSRPFYKKILKKIADSLKNILKALSKKFYDRLKNSPAKDIYELTLGRDNFAEAYKQTDENYGRPVEINNIVLMRAQISIVTGSLRRRISVKTLDKGKAIFFMDGCFINGTWIKICNDMAIRFFDEKGERINFNPGNIWIEILADDDQVKIGKNSQDDRNIRNNPHL